MTWLVLGIALALPVFLYLLLMNVGVISDRFAGKPRISIYLQHGLGQVEAEKLMARLSRDARTETVAYISPDAALEGFQSRSGFGDVLESLDRNPLPGLIELTPQATQPAILARQVTDLEGEPGVDMVVVDLAWVERLFALVAFGERLVMALAAVLALGVLLVIGNTIRLAIESRRSEIEVVKLVGGTDGFVRRPFLYLGFWYGVGGAVIALLLVQVSLLLLDDPVQKLAQSYQDDFSLRGPGVLKGFGVVVIGAVLGVLGASLAVSKHLRTFAPSKPE